MNKIEVISKKEILNKIDGIMVMTDDDRLTLNINQNITDPIVLINEFYNDILVKIEDDVVVSLLEIKDKHKRSDFNYKYILGNNSKATINKFYYMDEYNEDINVDLEGNEANVLINLSVMSFDHQQYKINIKHNNKKTISNINNHGVTLGNGTIDLIVNGIVKKGMSDSVLNQDNRIMIMGSGRSIIRPNLYIDENMVEAKHGASIGRFNDEEIFYLETRGIPEIEGYHLLMKGFLLGTLKLDNDVQSELSDIIEKYGR
jgi:hypothetical protein